VPNTDARTSCARRAGSVWGMADERATDPHPWHIFGERTLYDSPWVRLTLVDVEPPGTKRFEHHVVRLHRVAIAAVLDDQDRVLMIRRYRFVPDRWGWELPGGIVDQGEDAAKAAAREVEEETGWRPSTLVRVAEFEPMIGMVESPHEVFVGMGATYVGEPTDPEEAGSVGWISLAEIPGMLARGELAGSGTLVGLLHLLALGKPEVNPSA
jgi:8-oxo-dGTP pyrophosphatase MutT (NUDIX family)